MFRRTLHLLSRNTPSKSEALKTLSHVSSINRLPEKIKPTTRLVGVPVQPRWRQMTITLCEKIKTKLNNEIPQGVFYRTATENNVAFIQRVCEQYDDYEVVEDILDRGQMEQVIMMLEDELELVDMMKKWKPWEVSRRDLTEAKQDLRNGEDYQFPAGVRRVPEEEMTWKTTKGVRKMDDLEWTPQQLKEHAESQKEVSDADLEDKEKQRQAA